MNQIQISDGKGNMFTVPGDVRNQFFAVNKVYNKAMQPAEGRKSYRVTHLPTGLGLSMNRPLTKQAAFTLAKQLVELPVNWDFTDVHMMPEAERKLAMQFVREYENTRS